MSRGRNAYRKAGWWISGTGWTADSGAAITDQDDVNSDQGAVAADEIRHGVTLDSLHQAARIATLINGHMVGAFAERYELAWSAIAEHLCATDEPPTQRELVRVGSDAINTHVNSMKSDWGMSYRLGGEVGSAPRWLVYWWDQAAVVPSHEGGIVDRIALTQIIALLPSGERKALSALAACDGDRDLAAAMLGISRVAYAGALTRARTRFRRLWHEGEKPSQHWIQDRGGSRGWKGRYMVLAQRRSKRRRRLAVTRGEGRAA